MKKRKYAIVDIETTGGMYLRDKITEVAIIVTDGDKILEEYQTLINPERSIPYHITNITGIDDHMVSEAPKFYEVAKTIVEKLDGCIFVAHNVNFDYNFIKEEFKSLGFPFNKKKLCTVKLCRSTLPGLSSYGLDNLVDHFDIDVEHRHRAYDDTLATFKIFRHIVTDLIDEYHVDKIINQGLDASVLPKGMSIEDIHGTPEMHGVYYLSNKHDRILYVGKANNIRKRVFQHFRKITIKSNNIYKYVDKLHYEETGNELIALLLELYEIKRLSPELNKAMKRQNYNFAIYKNPKAKDHRHTFIIGRNNKANDFKYEKLKLFGTKGSAEAYVQNYIIEEEVCTNFFKSRATELACHCLGECDHFFTDPSDQIENFVSSIKNEFEDDFVILLPGRNDDEQSFVMIHEKKFWGFGYVPLEETISTSEHWNDYVSYQFWYPEANGIIKNYMSKHMCEIIDL